MTDYTEEQYQEYFDLYIKSGSLRQTDRIEARVKIPFIARDLGEKVMQQMYERARKETGDAK